MKKVIITMMMLIAGLTAAKAGNDKPISPEKLPVAAKEFITRYFPEVKVSYAKVDNELFDTTYEVVFVNGNKVEFVNNGKWKEVDCKFDKVPAGIVPSAIEDYIKQNHPDNYVVEIDRDKRDYELKLNNGIELKFDLKYNFIRYDD